MAFINLALAVFDPVAATLTTTWDDDPISVFGGSAALVADSIVLTDGGGVGWGNTTAAPTRSGGDTTTLVFTMAQRGSFPFSSPKPTARNKLYAISQLVQRGNNYNLEIVDGSFTYNNAPAAFANFAFEYD